MTEDAEVERVVRIGCAAADVHLMCSYPTCKCRQIPAAVKAAIAALRAGDEKPDFKALADETYEKWLRSEFGHGGIREAIEAGIRAGAASPRYGWNDISTAPKDGTWVFLWLPSPRSCSVVARWLDLDDDEGEPWHEWQQQGGMRVSVKPFRGPTLWQPIPKDPEPPAQS